MTYPTTPGHVATDTSIAAADGIAGDAASLRERVWHWINGTSGRTCDEVEYCLNMRHQTASARIRELVLAGRLIDSGERRLTRSGRKAIVYRTGMTITCGDCGKSEFFPGGLIESVTASQNSSRWFTDEKGFFVCGCRTTKTVAPTATSECQPKRQMELF